MHSPDLFCMRISGFPDSSAGKESACNAGDPSSIPGSERSIGEKIGYPLQYSWASLMAQLVKNLPAMRETWVRSLGWEDPLEKEKVTHFSILTWRIPWTEKSMGSQRVGHDWVTFTFPRPVWKLKIHDKESMALGQNLEMSSRRSAAILYLLITVLSSLHSPANTLDLILIDITTLQLLNIIKEAWGFFLHERLRENFESKNLFIVTSSFLRKWL